MKNKKPTLTQQVQYLESRIDAQADAAAYLLARNREREQRLSDLENRTLGLPGLFERVRALEVVIAKLSKWLRWLL